MKALARSLIAVAALSLFWSGQAPADEWAERSAIHGWSYMLFRHERFAELEALSAKFRTSRSRTPSGLWHLTLFYSGLAAALSAKPDDDESWEKAERSVKDWIAAYPRSPSAHLAYAEILDNRAWSIRGSGFAHTVKPENWKPFEAHM